VSFGLAIVYHAEEAEDTWRLFRPGISQSGHRGGSGRGWGRRDRAFSGNGGHEDEVDSENGETETSWGIGEMSPFQKFGTLP